MSNYPPPGYGPRDQMNAYPTPTYPNQYFQVDNSRAAQGQDHMNPNYESYGYNRGLPTFSTAALSSGVPPLPIYQSWNQNAPQQQAYSTQLNSSQYHSYNVSQRTAPFYPSNQTLQPTRPLDQELSEGEFEENGISTSTPPIDYGGYIDSVHPAPHQMEQDYSPHRSSQTAMNNYPPAHDNYQSARQQSSSYSPFVSPESNDDQQPATHSQEQNTYMHDNRLTNSTSHLPYGWSQNMQDTTSQPNANGASSIKVVDSNNLGQTRAAVNHPPNGKSIAEGKKKAQDAILSLVPFDVQYKTYIDEGFKEDIINRLFDDLRIPRIPSKTANGNGRTAERLGESLQYAAPSSGTSFRQNSAAVVANRNLAPLHQQIIQDLPGATVKTHPSTAQKLQPLTESLPPKPQPSMNDKERTIQAKMEALRKSREERAQKAAAQKHAKVTTPAVLPSANEEPKPTEESQAAELTEKLSNSTLSEPSIPQTAPYPPSQVADAQPSHPAIPGLFLSSTTSSPGPPANGYSLSQSNPRKRPVAADFDGPIPPMSATKRPFGHSRSEQPLVIDVSEDEAESDDEDVEMDLESEANQDSPIQSTRSLPDQRSTAIPNFSLSNFTARKPASPVSSRVATPPLSQVATRSSLAGRPEDLQRKESEIEILKKKIAEAEARKKARQSSGTRTPKSTETSSVDESTGSGQVNTSNNLEASIAMQRLIGIASKQAISDQKRLAQVEAEERNKVEELRQNEADHIRLRRQHILAELPKVESEYQQNRRKLEEMRAEIARIEASVQKYEEQKQRYAEEMARLSEETEIQLQAEQAKLAKLTTEEVERSEGMQMISSAQTLPPRLSFGGDAYFTTAPQRSSSGDDVLTTVTARDQLKPSALTEEHRASNKPTRETLGEENQVPVPAFVEQQIVPVVGNTSTSASHDSTPQPPTLISQNPSVEDSARVGGTIEHEGTLEAGVISPINEAETFEPGSSQPRNVELLATDQPPAGESNTFYSPPSQHTSQNADRDSDGYEPPEATPNVESPIFSPAPPTEDIEVGDSLMPDAVLDPVFQSISHTTLSEPLDVDSDQQILPPQNGSALNVSEVLPETYQTSQYFTPYESPLRRFRGYRFHPNFQQLIPGGLRSLTYSHKIDPSKELCRYEAAGGICNDSTCELQHFKDISLPDDVILTALGSPEEFKGPKRDEFCSGLKAVLMDLRVRKIRDFDVIASEILAYRAKFLGDSSRVLSLDGISI